MSVRRTAGPCHLTDGRAGQCSRPTRSTFGACAPRCGRTARRPSATSWPASRAHGDAAFLVYEDERTTFEEHFRAAAHLARHHCGTASVCENGDRVAIAMRNFPEWSVAFWAAAAAGAVVVPLNAWWTGEELHYGLADSGSQVLICDQERADRISPYLHLPAGPAHHRRGPGLDRDLPLGMLPYEDVLGEVPADGGAARRGHRARRRRHHLLHVGDHGTAQGGARHPPQHLHQPDQPALRQRPQRLAGRHPGRPELDRQPERIPAVGPAVPRHRVPLDPGDQHSSPAASWS